MQELHLLILRILSSVIFQFLSQYTADCEMN